MGFVACSCRVCNSFEIVYGKSPTSPLDLLPSLIHSNFSCDANERAKQIKKLHEQVRDKIQKQTRNTNHKLMHRRHVSFKEGDKVWIICGRNNFKSKIP